MQKLKFKVKLPKSYILILLFSFCFLSLLVGCEKKKTKEIAQEIIPVKVMKLKLEDIQETLDYVGNIKAEDEVVVYPKVSGKIIQKVKEEGSLVTKGEVIAYIDRDEVGLKFEKAPVESPLSGVVGKVYVDIGANVNIATPVALVVNMDKVKIDFDVPEKYLPQVSLGQEAKISVDAYPEEEFSGWATKISPLVDLTTRSASIEISIDNPQHRLKSGMFARVKLIIQEHQNVPLVLKEAIMGTEPNLYVYMVENKKAMLRKVSLGLRQGPYYEVKEGLKEGDLVVIMGQQRLRDGVSVIAEQEKGVEE